MVFTGQLLSLGGVRPDFLAERNEKGYYGAASTKTSYVAIVAAEQANQPKPVIKNLLVAGAAIIITLFVIEIGLRILPQAWTGITLSPIPAAVEDEVLGWRPNPQHPDHDRKGFRNAFVPEEADVVAIGDSQTYGEGVAADQAWPQQLQVLGRTTVYNMGFGGYGPGHSLFLWEEAVAFKPRLIVEAFYAGNDAFDSFNLAYNLAQVPDLRTSVNDDLAVIAAAEKVEPLIEKVSRLYNEGSATGDTAGPITWSMGVLVTHSRIYVLLRRALRAYVNRVDEYGLGDLRWSAIRQDALQRQEYREIFDNGSSRTVFTPSYRLTAVDLSDPRIVEGHRISLKAIQRMHEQAQAAGIEFVVLLIPTKEMVFDEVVQQDSANFSATYFRLIEQETLFWHESKKFLEKQGIGYVDSLPALRAALQQGDQPYQISHDGHPNAIGHRVISELVLREIVE